MSTKSDKSAGEFEPYIPASSDLPELRALPILIGTVLGMIFGASSLYLVLKVGLTVSASIPVAVISIALFRVLSKFGLRDATILENNIVQTAGSAGESIAFGVGVTMPAILILGFDLEVTRVILVSVLGALLGILMMIPLRRALIVQQHGTLKYPEGTACAEVLKAGASHESQIAAARGAKVDSLAETATIGAKTIFTGFGLGIIYNVAMKALYLWKDTPGKVFDVPLKGGSLACEITPELLGVGYVIGPRIAAVMAAGGVLSYLVLIPLIQFFGEGLAGPLAPGTALIKDMSPNQIRGAYILYIGAGAVAAGGIISLVRSLPLIWRGIRDGLRDFRGKGKGGEVVPRTDRDLPLKLVFIGIAALVVAILFTPSLHMNIAGAVLIVLCGFLFVTVSSRLTGEIGSSSNPISGMTIATLLLTCLAFLALGWTDRVFYITALSVGGIVCIASSNGGTTSQDLKTGFLIGSTPSHQQIAILIGALASALVLGPILLKLNDVGKVYVPVTSEIRADVSQLSAKTKLTGPQGKQDGNSYFVWHQEDEAGGAARQYLVDDTGKAVYFVDPGINGTVTKRPDGSEVKKFDAPKATLVSYIIKGILSHKLPWALVLFGVMISIVLELCAIPSLAFAVGVYLPLATSMPVFIGGAVRWWVDAKRRRHADNAHLTEEEHVAEGDKSPGVLMASGYIAGGAIAGIAIAFMAGVFSEVYDKLEKWAAANNPFYTRLTPSQISPDLLALIPFAAMIAVLYLAGSGKILAGRKGL
ncbi:MAG: oligopeptide transporter, OPT family [Chthoniobacter sp.]|uniref:OPT family oligopeptide transporter n=1 Tax=Chthoniobacter sp. TaxID=2510640 RepID=UPI0032ACEA4A